MNKTKINDAKIEKIKKIKVLRQMETAPPQNNELSPGVMNKLADLIQTPAASILGFGVGSKEKRSSEENFSSIINTKPNTKPNIENRRNTIRKKWKQQATRERANRAIMLARLREMGRARQIRELAHAPPNGRALHQTSSARNLMFRPKRRSKSNNTNKKNPFAKLVGGKTRKRRKKKN